MSDTPTRYSPPAPNDVPTHTLPAPTTQTFPRPESTPADWRPGGSVGEFELLSELGRGGLGIVYLARQSSLGRLVALKVSEAAGLAVGEGHALAGLEHDHIVKVYSGFAEPGTGKHCLCLQYVPGTNLHAVIRHLYADGHRPTRGADLLDAVDALAAGDSRFDPAALRDREALAAADFPRAVCRLGAQLADALGFAHGRGVLHCDVKPGNILLTPYGRPMLVDFNVSADVTSGMAGGGTPGYMAPEHEAAVRGDPATVDGRADVFALGSVLYELATGDRVPKDGPDLSKLPPELGWVFGRCLQPTPADRYASADELAAALRGAGKLSAARQRLPAPGPFARLAIRYPLRMLLALALAPHVVGTALNIGYNEANVALTAAQKAVFPGIVVGYNTLIYSVTVSIGVWLLHTVWAGMRAVSGPGRRGGPAADAVRRRVLALGRWAIGLGLLGWVPGAVVFPLALHLLAGPLPLESCAHFAVSFVLSGLVGVVYSYFGIQYVVLRALVPNLGDPDHFTPAGSAAEVRRATAGLDLFLVLATVVPLAGAVLLVSLADERMTVGFRLLVTSLIGLGMAGVAVLARAKEQIGRLAAVWASGERQYV